MPKSSISNSIIITEGEITKTYKGKSRRGVLTYWSYAQEVRINGTKHIVRGADESWLKLEKENLIKSQTKLINPNCDDINISTFLMMVSIVSITWGFLEFMSN